MCGYSGYRVESLPIVLGAEIKRLCCQVTRPNAMNSRIPVCNKCCAAGQKQVTPRSELDMFDTQLVANTRDRTLVGSSPPLQTKNIGLWVYGHTNFGWLHWARGNGWPRVKRMEQNSVHPHTVRGKYRPRSANLDNIIWRQKKQDALCAQIFAKNLHNWAFHNHNFEDLNKPCKISVFHNQNFNFTGFEQKRWSKLAV